jgi:hypothetical protein
MAITAGMTTWEKQNTKLFADFGTSETPKINRIGKSTTFDLVMNAETETLDFIEDASPTELVKSYKPSLAQDLYMAEGDPAFDDMFALYLKRPVGGDAVKPIILVYPKAGTTENTFVAQKAQATIVFTNFNTVDKKLNFDLKFADIVNGTATFTEGKPTFTADVTP